jgi:hypothetical protein
LHSSRSRSRHRIKGVDGNRGRPAGPDARPRSRRAIGANLAGHRSARVTIGIGVGLAASPSHTTGHTGLLSPVARTRQRSPEVRPTAFAARPDGRGLRDHQLARQIGSASYPVLVHRAATLLHASFRTRLATTPLRFANPSPPSGWMEDFYLQAVDHVRHTEKAPPRRGQLQDVGTPCVGSASSNKSSRSPLCRLFKVERTSSMLNTCDGRRRDWF